MANFKISWSKTRVHEGGYNNDPKDNGGETYRGISRKNFPNWPGWAEVIKSKRLRGDIILTLEPLVEKFYIDNFWNPIKGDEIINQEVADELFDSSVLLGIHQSVILTQRSLNIPESGKMDSSTLNILNQNNPYV